MEEERTLSSAVCSFEEISEALRWFRRRLPKDKILEYMGELGTCEVIGPSLENALLVCLLYEWERSEEKTVVHKFSSRGDTVFPSTQFFGIISIDWPGMSDSCVGIFHERKWNISFIKGTVVPHRGEMLGVVLVGVMVESMDTLNELKKESPSITHSLKSVAAGDRAKAWLIAREAEKYETYMTTINRIRDMYQGKDLEALLGESGEAVMFFASRPVAYIRERRPSDLARQIIDNYEAVNKVRSSGGEAQVKLGNIKTEGGYLTGVSIAGYERDFTLDDCLRAINHVAPGFQIKFNKEFRTTDGIIVYRIEIVNRDGAPFNLREINRIKAALCELAKGRRFERIRWVEKFGGVEGYARALIPYLAREQKNSGTTQVYITLGQTIELFAEFKILIVSAMRESRLERTCLKVLDRLDSARGLSLVSYKTSRGPHNTLVQIVDLRADLAHFGGPDRVYARIKEILSEVIGEFRDFDRGGRTEEAGKVERLLARLKGVDYLTVREIYFHLDDFYRLGASVNELGENIETVMSVLERFKKAERKRPFVLGRNIISHPPEGKDVVVATILVVVDRTDGKRIKGWLDRLRGYDVTMSKIEKENAVILHLRISENGRPLPNSKLGKVLRDLRKVARTP
ncbi:MAG: hypothetical protein ACE5JA_00440 [bacterium]